MAYYGIDESSVNDTVVTVKIACPICDKVETGNISAESLTYMTLRSDGIYVDESECAECISYIEHHKAGRPL